MYNDKNVKRNAFYCITILVVILSIAVLGAAVFFYLKNGKNGSNQEVVGGKSAYDIAKENGFNGSLSDYLKSIKGEDGESGKTPYEMAKESGFEGDEKAWIMLITGNDGDNGDSGMSSYEIAKNSGFDGTYEQYQAVLRKIGLDDTVGPKGDKGPIGLDVLNCTTSYTHKNNDVFYQFDFDFSDGSKCKKRTLIEKEILSIDENLCRVFNSSVESRYFFFKVTYKDYTTGTAYIPNEYIDDSNVVWDTPGKYDLSVDYKGVKASFTITIYTPLDNKYTTSSITIPKQYIPLLDDDEDYNDLTIDAKYSYSYNGTEPFKFKYGDNFDIEHPEMLYKSYYAGRDVYAVVPNIYTYYYNLNYSTYEYEKQKNWSTHTDVVFYDPDNIVLLNSENILDNTIFSINDDIENVLNEIKNMPFIKYTYSDGSIRYTKVSDVLTDEMILEGINGARTTLNKNYNVNVKFDGSKGGMSENGCILYSDSYSEWTSYVCLYCLSEDWYKEITNIYYYDRKPTFKNYELGIDSSYYSSSYTEYVYVYYNKETGKVENKLYDETSLKYLITFALTNFSFSKTFEFTLDELLSYVDYDRFEVTEDNKSYIYLKIPFYGATLDFRFNNYYLYDDYKYNDTSSYSNTYKVEVSDSLEDFLSKIEFNVNIYHRFYLNNREINSMSNYYYNANYKINGLDAYNECKKNGEEFIRNVDGVPYDVVNENRDDFNLFYKLPGSSSVESERFYVYENVKEDNYSNINYVEIHGGDLMEVPVGTSIDDIFFDYIMGEEAYVSLYNIGSFDMPYKKEWIDYDSVKTENGVFTEPGIYFLKIVPFGFIEEATSIPIIVTPDFKEENFVGTYTWDIRNDEYYAMIIGEGVSYLAFDLYNDGTCLMYIGFLEMDEYDPDTETYTFIPYIEISFPASYSINDDILTIESGHITYQEFKIIDDDNNLILNIPETIDAEIVYYNYSYDDKDDYFNRYIFYDNGYVLIEAGEVYDDNEQSYDYPWDRYSSIAYTKYEEVEEDLYLVYLTGMFYKVFRYYDINGEITEYMDSVYSEFGW